VTVLQMAENLTGRQAAEAVRDKLSWAYALGLSLEDGEAVRAVLEALTCAVPDWVAQVVDVLGADNNAYRFNAKRASHAPCTGSQPRKGAAGAMISQRAWLRRHVAPAVEADGWELKRDLFQLAGEHGDCALLEIRNHPLEPGLETFFVRASVVPFPQRAWAHREGWEIARHWDATSADAMVQWDVLPSTDIARPPTPGMPAGGYWAYGPGVAPDDCARALVATLREGTLPEVRRLLDREHLLREIRDPSPGVQRRRPPGWGEVLLRVDRISLAELEPFLECVERDYPMADEFLTWARHYSSD
jgi:hypothetical protein